MPAKKAKIIAVAGGSGSGKTTLVNRLRAQVGESDLLVLQMDHYYSDLSGLSQTERDRCNFDHPDALDRNLMVDQLRRLAAGETVARPNYDFSTHTRKPEATTISSRPVIVFDGILALHFPEVCELIDLGIYVDVDDDVRFIRRLKRDITERGRTVDSVISQYMTSVKPMHDLHVATQKHVADIIVSWMDYNDSAVAMVAALTRTWLPPKNG